MSTNFFSYLKLATENNIYPIEANVIVMITYNYNVMWNRSIMGMLIYFHYFRKIYHSLLWSVMWCVYKINNKNDLNSLFYCYLSLYLFINWYSGIKEDQVAIKILVDLLRKNGEIGQDAKSNPSRAETMYIFFFLIVKLSKFFIQYKIHHVHFPIQRRNCTSQLFN